MVITTRSLEEMMEDIVSPKLVYFWYYSPLEKSKEHWQRSEWKRLDYLNPLQPIVYELLNSIPPELIIASDWILRGALSLAIENSLTRGHRAETYLRYSLKLFAGEEGCIIRIRDSGKGFNHHSHIRERRSGQRNFRGYGKGIWFLDSSSFEAAYEGNGSVLNIMVKKGYCLERSVELNKP